MMQSSSFEDSSSYKAKGSPSQSPPPSFRDGSGIREEEHDNASSSYEPPKPAVPQPPPPKILWSCIARDDVILAEANDVGIHHSRDEVADAARQLLQQPRTPGFEYHTHNRIGGLLKNRFHKLRKDSTTTGDRVVNVPLKGIKFHVYEHVSEESLRSTDGLDDEPPTLRVWVFAAIFDPNGTNRRDVQSFLEKLVYMTETLRSYDPEWKLARTLGLQASFAPTLQQRMEEVTYLGKMSLLQHQVQACQEQMEQNIDLMLENGTKATELDEEATHLKDMCKVFQKKAKEVKRHHMLQNAKYGMVLGTAVTGLAAAVIVPLVAL
jgi:Synaptobrevin